MFVSSMYIWNYFTVFKIVLPPERSLSQLSIGYILSRYILLNFFFYLIISSQSNTIFLFITWFLLVIKKLIVFLIEHNFKIAYFCIWPKPSMTVLKITYGDQDGISRWTLIE